MTPARFEKALKSKLGLWEVRYTAAGQGVSLVFRMSGVKLSDVKLMAQESPLQDIANALVTPPKKHPAAKWQGRIPIKGRYYEMHFVTLPERKASAPMKISEVLRKRL